MRLLWSFIFALAKADLTIKLGSNDTPITNLTLDDGKIKADGVEVKSDAAYAFTSTLGTVEKLIFGRLRMVSSLRKIRLQLTSIQMIMKIGGDYYNLGVQDPFMVQYKAAATSNSARKRRSGKINSKLW